MKNHLWALREETKCWKVFNALKLQCFSIIRDLFSNAYKILWSSLFKRVFLSAYNLGQNICRLFQFLTQSVFTTSKAELDYYQHRVNVRVASRVAERFKS